MIRLFGSLTSPYVRKVRVVAAELALAVDFTVVDAWSPDNGIPARSPLGKVPVIEIDGMTLFDSTLIIEYLDSRSGNRLIPAAGPARWAVLRWHALAHGLIDAAATRTLETRRPAEHRSPAVLAREAVRIARVLDGIEAALAGPGPLAGDTVTLADLALGVAVGYVDFRYPHDWRGTRPNLAGWAAEIHRRPSFQGTLPPQ
jgi:glutathione S-transferase